MASTNLLSAVRGLEQAVYYRDVMGRYASLPSNNSLRIDLLSSRLNELTDLVESNIGTDTSSNFNEISNYLDGSNTIGDFPDSSKMSDDSNDIIKVASDTDKDKYKNVQEALQQLYDTIKAENDNDTYINVSNNDGYVKMNSDGNCFITGESAPSDYNESMQVFRNPSEDDEEKQKTAFKYLYNELIYTYDRVMNMENNFNVFEGVSIDKE